MYTLATWIAFSTISGWLSFIEPSGATNVVFDPQRGQVVVKVPAADVSPSIDAHTGRSLQVFENGVRQRDVEIGVAHAPVSVAVLIEMGGRSYELTQILQSEADHLVRPLLDRLGPDDKLAIYTYDSALRPLVDFSAARETWSATLNRFKAPRFSEANLYDAASQLLDHMKSIEGRRAIVLLTTGIDTFSRTRFDDLVARAREARTPIYWLALGDLVRNRMLDVSAGPLARVNWPRLTAQCTQLARVSKGRCYENVRSLTTPAIFDDIIEQLRVQFVLTYVSPNPIDGRGRVVDVRLSHNPNPSLSRGVARVSTSSTVLTAKVLPPRSFR